MIAKTESCHQLLFEGELLLCMFSFILHTFWKIFPRAKMIFHEHFMFFAY